MDKQKKHKELWWRLLAAVLIAGGIVTMAVPFCYRLHGEQETNKLIEQIEEEQDGKAKTTHKEKEDALLSKENVIGIIEIPSLDIRYPILEGAGSEQMVYGIGHMSDTAGIGKKGNCVLCGHNGSRNGTFFTTLNTVAAGDVVILIDKNKKEYRYKVSRMYIVEPYDNRVKEQGKEEELTLITCANSGTMRFICKCVLEDTKEGKKADGK